ncbi:MAG: heme-copper oxidase subunit III [Chloroflexota bacterium]
MLNDKYRLAMIVFLASEAVFFIILIRAYVFYRNSPANAGGPTPFNSLDVGRTGIFTACLWSSSVTIWMAGRSHKRGGTMGPRVWLLLTIALGGAFLYGEASEYITMASVDRTTPSSDVFASTFFALTGFHGLHVFVGLALLCILLGLAMTGAFNDGRRRAAVETISLYWHFVDGVWVFIFPTVYLWSLAGPGPR